MNILKILNEQVFTIASMYTRYIHHYYIFIENNRLQEPDQMKMGPHRKYQLSNKK